MTTEIVKADEAATVPEPRGLTPQTARRLALAERLLYGAAGTWAAVGPLTDVPWWAHGGVVLTGLASGRRLWKRTNQENGPGLLLSAMRSLPVLGWSGAYTAALLAPVVEYPNGWPMLGAAAWTAVMVPMAPWTRSRGLQRAIAQMPEYATAADEAPVLETVPAPTTYEGHLRLMWTTSPSTGETQLSNLRQYCEDHPDFDAVILAPAGQAVPVSVTQKNVAAVFDVPPAAVHLEPVDGYGPGRMALRVTPSDVQEDAQRHGLEQLWHARVSGPGGMLPGMDMIDHRIDEDRVRILVEADDSAMIALPRKKLARALKVEDPDLVMVETDGMARGVVTIYREHPLINIREATREDLTMGPDGFIRIGLRHDGRPFKMALYSPELGGLTDLAVGAMGSGKSVFLLTVLAAERISGIISLVADAQSGMSLPEAKGRVYHFGAGIAELGATLAAACAVADFREAVSSANGWGSFTLGSPWRLVNVTLDEINMVLGEHALVPPAFRKWVTGMVARLQQTGRKFGFGIRFAGQSIHVTDLGDAEKIRANAKQGLVWMGRVNSTMTQSMAADMVTDGTEIHAIRPFFGNVSDDLFAAWDGKETPPGPVTAGMAWGLQGGRAVLMRVFKALKESKTYPHLIRLFESAPTIPGFSPEEDRIFRTAYAEALAAAEAFLAGEDADGDGDEGDSGKKTKRSLGPGKASIPEPPKLLKDQILEVLADGKPRRTREIRSAVGVGTDGGPASGSVDNTLSKLFDERRVTKPGHGTWALAPEAPAED
ncbi:hypothetical protein ABZ957_15505 [Streptomyces sp. NPDC046316]|uniref:hypothetical protein n=1 Tax=Streptomyces sp. NPDC046316 TaxID=3154494 RepID=UPI00340443D9